MPRWRRGTRARGTRAIRGDRAIEHTYLVLSRARIVQERVEGARGERAERSLRVADRTGRGQRRCQGTLGKSEVTCFPSVARFGRRRARGCWAIRANRTTSWIAVWVKIRTLVKSASATSTSPKLTGEKTWGRWKETKRRQSIGSRGCRRRTRAWGAEITDTSRRVEDLMHMGRR